MTLVHHRVWFSHPWMVNGWPRHVWIALIVPYFNFKRSNSLWLAEDPVLAVLFTLARLSDLVADGGEELVQLAQVPGCLPVHRRRALPNAGVPGHVRHPAALRFLPRPLGV